jgi:hypothetical protein
VAHGITIDEVDSAGSVSNFFSDASAIFYGLFFDAGSIYAADQADGTVAGYTGNFFDKGRVRVFNASTVEEGNELSANQSMPFTTAKYKGTDRVATLPPSQEVYDFNADVKDLQVNVKLPSGIANDAAGNIYVADQTGNAIFKFDISQQNSVFAESGLSGPNFLTFGPAVSAPLVSVSASPSPAPLEGSGQQSITVTRSGVLNQAATVRLYTVDPTTYSPQILHYGFFDSADSHTPRYLSTNDVLFQDAVQALPGRDYLPISMTLVFAPNETTKPAISIPILNNNAVNGRRQFKVALEPQTAPLTVGPTLIQTIIDDESAVQVTGATITSSSVAEDGARTFSASVTVLNRNLTAVGPLQVRLFGHANFNNPPENPTNPLPPLPADSDLGVLPFSLGLVADNSTATATFDQAVIPKPEGDAYGYNTWFWIYAVVEQQINGNFTAISAPWLVIDGSRKVSGYVNPDGTITGRTLWNFGGSETGTPGTVVGNIDTGLITGGGPPPTPTPTIPGLVPFQLDGKPDPSPTPVGSYLQVATGPKLYAAIRQASGRTLLYVASQSPGFAGDADSKDVFIFVTDQLLDSASTDAPWGKAGKIACAGTKPFLGGESRDNYVAWYNCGSGAQSVKLSTTDGVMEGVLDLQSAFGSVPQTIYVAAAAYGTLNGGTLMSQSPSGNADANIDRAEFVALTTSNIIDNDANGVYDPPPTPPPTPPKVSTLNANPPGVNKTNPTTSMITVTLTAANPSSSQPIMVNYSLSGNAVLNGDYTLSGTQIAVPPNQSSGSVTLTVTTAKTKGREKAIMTLGSGSGYSLPTVGKKAKVKPPKVTVTISNK